MQVGLGPVQITYFDGTYTDLLDLNWTLKKLETKRKRENLIFISTLFNLGTSILFFNLGTSILFFNLGTSILFFNLGTSILFLI